MTLRSVESPPDDLGALRGLLTAMERRLRIAAEGARGPAPKSESLGTSRRLRSLVERCGLSAFEAQIVLLGAAMELQPAVAGLCAQIAGQPSAPWPTFRVALAALPGGHWDALLPSAPLRRLRLMHLADGHVLTERPLHLSERVLHALLGSDELDPRVSRRVRRLAAPTKCPASHAAVTPRLQAAWRAEPSFRVHVQAARTGECLAWVSEAAEQAGLCAFHLPAMDVPTDAGDLDEFIALWNREVRLTNVALAVDLDDRADNAQLRAARELAEQVDGAVVAISRDPLPHARGLWLRLALEGLGFEERRALWQASLNGGPTIPDNDLDDLAARFELDLSQITQVGRELVLRERDSLRQALWNGSRALARPRLEDLAQRIIPSESARLVLPEVQSRMLDALVAQVRHKATVHHRWGLETMGTRGAGTSAVFSGPSGTGKTLAAEVIAARLDLDLYRIDLSAVVSKFIGETEKNMRRVFDAAEAGGSVLLFDEADALFGKRTEVRDSHDRHANIEVSYLLQRMESYGGLAILTTNFRKAIDDAFLRRIQFVVEFPFPDEKMRARIWAGIFPEGVPTRGLEPTRLAQLSVPGGNIQSIARNAAYLAADAGSPVTMALILEAARLEAEKLGRGLTPRELAGWNR